MFSLLKEAFSRCTLILDNSFYTIRTSTYLGYLRDIRHIAETESRPLDNTKYKTFLLSRTFLYLAMFIYIFRALAIVRLQVLGASLTVYTSVDPLLTTMILKNPSLNYLTLSAIALLGFFPIFTDYHYSFSLDFYLVNILYNIVSNRDRFFTLNPRLQLPQQVSLRQPKLSYLKLRHWYKEMLNPLPSPTFAHSNGPLTHVSPRLRTRLVLQCALYEALLACLNLTLALSLVPLAVSLLLTVYQEVSFPLFLVVFFETLLLAPCFLHTITNLCFAFHSILLPRFLTRAHIKELNHSLMTLLIQLRYLKGALTSSHQLLLQRQLSFFYGEHRFLVYFQQYFNAKVASGSSLASFLTNILVQIIFLNLLLRRELKPFEIAVICLFLFFQMLLMILACQVGITWTNSLYSPAPLLFQAQSHLRRPTNALTYPRHLSAKIHLMTYFELLCTEEKALFTLGSFADISTSALFQFFFAYTGFFMYISMLMADLHFY